MAVRQVRASVRLPQSAERTGPGKRVSATVHLLFFLQRRESSHRQERQATTPGRHQVTAPE